MWAFSVSGKEILNFSNYQNSKIPEVVVVGYSADTCAAKFPLVSIGG